MSFFGNLSNLFGSARDQLDTQSAPSSKTNKPSKQAKPKKSKPSKPQVTQQQVNSHDLVREAQAQAKEIILEAKDQALQLKSQAEQAIRKQQQELDQQQRELTKKLDKIDNRLEQLDQRDQNLDKVKQDLEKKLAESDKLKAQLASRLEEVSQMTQDEAKQTLLDGVEKQITRQMSQQIRRRQEELEAEADQKAQQILVDAMKYGATDEVAEYTVSTVKLPSDDVKGKIIGKNGRNIHAFERITGVDLDLDSGPGEVKLSSFDSVRREIARVSLEKLVKDGRIQPTRIEEIVAKTKKDIDKIMFEAGKKLAHDAGVYNLPNGLIQMLGRFKYRTSYGQNMITHTLEETKIGIKIAHEIGADVQTVKLGCLLHDIGKVAEEADESHVVLGVRIAKKFNMPQPVIDCIAQHHEDEPFSGPEQMVVYIADAISGARPGARYENFEEYVQRLEKIEEIATQYDTVKEAYAIQAGREVRVLLNPEKSKDDDVEVLALKIRDQIKEEVTYPGTVTVTVIREKRGKQIAK